jgi:hypothetical protein
MNRDRSAEGWHHEMIKMQACISFEGVVNIRAPGLHTNVSKFT